MMGVHRTVWIVVAVAILAAACGEPASRSASSTPSLASSPNKSVGPSAVGRTAQSCIAASALPQRLASAATSSDCVTGFTTLSDGTVVGGTAGGDLVLVAANGIRTIKTGGTGPVTALEPFFTHTNVSYQLVAYVVGEGIGIFDPRSATNLRFGINRPLVDKGGSPLTDQTRFVADNRFFVMQPVPGRPHLNSLGQYALTKPDGVDEFAFADVGTDGELCFVYGSQPGDVPEQVCDNVSDQLSLAPTPVSTTPTPPATGARCSVPSGVPADAAHTIRLVVSLNGVEPWAITVQAGERYVMTLTSSDSSNILYSYQLTDGLDRVRPDGNGSFLCLAGTNLSSHPVSTDFVAPLGGGVFYLTDMIHPHVRVKVTVELPSSPQPTLAPDVAALTPSGPAEVPTPIPSPTALPVTATRAP